MTAYEIINTVLAGGLLGSLGQGVRIAMGLKKLNDSNLQKTVQNQDPEPFSASRLVISIFIGFVAGAVALLIKEPGMKDYTTEVMVTTIAIGYSGADFIEGFFNTYLSKVTPASSSSGNDSGNTNAQIASSTTALQTQIPLLVNDESKLSNNQVLG